MLLPIESAVAALPSGTSVNAWPYVAALLDEIDSGAKAYEISTGLGPGTHYRRHDGDGCFHLRVNGPTDTTLHRDLADPRNSVGAFFEHMTEGPNPLVVLGIGVVLWSLFRGPSKIKSDQRS